MEDNVAKVKLIGEIHSFCMQTFGKENWSKPQRTGFEEILYHTIEGSVLLQDYARRGIRNTEMVESAHRRFRRLLDNEIYSEPIRNGLLDLGAQRLKDGMTVAIDHTDFTHPYASEGSGMTLVWDGSLKMARMGEMATGAFVVDPYTRQGFPMALELHQKYPDKNKDKTKGKETLTDETIRMIRAVSQKAKEKGVRVRFAMDRGMDALEIYAAVFEEKQDFVVRIQHARDLVGDTSKPLRDVLLSKPSTIGCVKLKERHLSLKLFAAEGSLGPFYPPVLVVNVEWDKGANMQLLASVPEGFTFTPKAMLKLARKVAQSYFERWGIEIFFQSIKHNFDVEKILIRNPKRRAQLSRFLTLGYVFIYHILRRSSAYERLSDDVRLYLRDAYGAFSHNINSFLSALRELLRYFKLPKRPGRKRKHDNATIDFSEINPTFTPA